MDKTWDNSKTSFTEAYFEVKEDSKLNKKHVGFMVDDTIDQPHVGEAHMTDALNNLANAVKSDTTNLTTLKMTNSKISEQLKVALSQNNVLTDFLRKKICGVTETQSENEKVNKLGIENCKSTQK